MINILPPATSLAVAPEASLEAAELQHFLICSSLHKRCVRQGGEGSQAAVAFLAFYFPGTQLEMWRLWQQTAVHEERRMFFVVFLHNEHYTDTHTGIKC